jgi:hypothetical protein
VGYCLDPECEDFAKGVFLLNHGATFYCARCRRIGKLVREEGSSLLPNESLFVEARVEFDYDPIHEKYNQIAIVRDESMPSTLNIYTLKSPLIRTETRALKVAEAMLSNLALYDVKTEGIHRTETLFNMDDDLDTFKEKLRRFEQAWKKSPLKKKLDEHL